MSGPCETRYMTTEQLAQYLQIPTATLIRWRYEKRPWPPYVKAGRLVRYDVAAVEAGIEGGELR